MFTNSHLSIQLALLYYFQINKDKLSTGVKELAGVYKINYNTYSDKKFRIRQILLLKAEYYCVVYHVTIVK